MDKNCIAIITARGGSKRIPRKNVKDFLGQPIIKYSIDAALQSSCFREVMVSTDDKEIAEISAACGATVPFLRSAATSGDFATTVDVLDEVIAEYGKQGRTFTYCCCIYPTAALISSKRLLEGYALLVNSNADSVIPVVRFSYPIQRAFKITDGRLSMIWPENLKKRSQDLMPAYQDCGQFYWMKTESFLKNRAILTDNTVALEMPESEIQDIDNEEDWKLAEMKFQLLSDGRK